VKSFELEKGQDGEEIENISEEHEVENGDSLGVQNLEHGADSGRKETAEVHEDHGLNSIVLVLGLGLLNLDALVTRVVKGVRVVQQVV